MTGSTGGKGIRAGVVGVSGYAGMELARILSRHPDFALTLVTSDKWAGAALGTKIALPPAGRDRICVASAEARTQLGGLDVVFLCTPAEVSIEWAPLALAAGARVVDLSGAFRLPAADYPRWYGFTHGQPGLLAEAVYSMPEATGAFDKLRAARLVSNPGCYPTAAALAVLPFLAAGLVDPRSLIIDAKSGTSGAGRKATEAMSFSEVEGDLRAYRVLQHQHTPEIERALALAGVAGARVVFTPHLLPTRRGILATAYGRLTEKAKKAGDLAAVVGETLAAFAQGRPFVRVVPPEAVTLAAVVGTNLVCLGAAADLEKETLVMFASEDNLVKGAAGQAVQNANLMFGLPETLGLDVLTGHLP